MGRFVALCAISLGGCSLFLGDNKAAPDDGGVDDAAVDTDADPACRATDTLSADLQADTLLTGGDPNSPYGDRTHATISLDLESVGLFRFDTSDLTQTAEVQELTLVLPHAATSDFCSGGSCGSCADVAVAGELRVFLSSNDWIEGEATHVVRGNGEAWDESPGDRGNRVGTADYEVDQTAVVVLDVEELTPLPDELTLLVEGGDNGSTVDKDWTKMVVVTLENECQDVGDTQAELIIDYCLP